MNIGDIRYEIPSIYDFAKHGTVEGQPRKCRVVYIHPLMRFYVVEFVIDNGYGFRESYYMDVRRSNGKINREETKQ